MRCRVALDEILTRYDQTLANEGTQVQISPVLLSMLPDWQECLPARIPVPVEMIFDRPEHAP